MTQKHSDRVVAGEPVGGGSKWQFENDLGFREDGEEMDDVEGRRREKERMEESWIVRLGGASAVECERPSSEIRWNFGRVTRGRTGVDMGVEREKGRGIAKGGGMEEWRCGQGSGVGA